MKERIYSMPNIKLHELYINISSEIAKCSYANRAKVGAVLVRGGRIISTGYNGMPTGLGNKCELPSGQTNPQVIHAEANAILYSARMGQPTEGSTLYVTYSPCVECAKMIIQAGIIHVIYLVEYRDTGGIQLLKDANIQLTQYH